MDSQQTESIAVFSGGSAANNLVDVFDHLSSTTSPRRPLSYIIPISDNGGSSSELIRVLGGPGIGDVRSRLVRLIPSTHEPERHAIKTLFNHRLPSSSDSARLEWLDIVEARSPLWRDIASEKRELIRSFLNVLNLELVKRNRPTSVFNFQSASIGNMFLTGARLFLGSFESAIYLLSSICAIPSHTTVLPAINTNFAHHICARLADGTEIRGQNSISHPSDPAKPQVFPQDGRAFERSNSIDHADTIEDANLPGSLPVLRKPYIAFNKAPAMTLDSAIEDEDAAVVPDAVPYPISSIYYINPYGQPIRPYPNPHILTSISRANTIIYSIGSLYTSLIPSLVLRGVGSALAKSPAAKVLILNGSLDRETCSRSHGAYTALDFVRAIASAARESEGGVNVDDPTPAPLALYVTHVVYVEGDGAPAVDRAAFAEAGIECVRVYGRRHDGGWRYDERALRGALEAVMGQGSGKGVVRRNTLGS